ncbi:MAG: hypothetical protein WD052_06015 [Bacteroidales bacterium]
MKKIEKFDHLSMGLIAGILVPFITFMVASLILYDGKFIDFIQQFKQMNRVSSLISLSAIPNLLLFFIGIWLSMYRAARGVIFATLILAFIMVIVKFL